jgi:hypothetical protein
VLLALAAGAGGFFAAWAATFTDQASVPANTFTTDTLAPPTGLTATVFWSSYIQLNWTATMDTYASGYKILRSLTSGGSYTEIGTADGWWAYEYYDSTAAPGIRYYYVLQTYFQNWTSVYSNEANAMVPTNTGWRSPTAQAAVPNPGNGDGDGFEQYLPTYAFADDTNYARDLASGTAGTLTCSDSITTRDRHLFYTYTFGIPSGSTIHGIEVRLDALATPTTGGARMCVQLSWDGGTTWSTGETTAALTTSQATYYLGSLSDTWGHYPWSSGEVSDTNFRLRITDLSNSTSNGFYLDWVPVRVTYTPP